MKPRIFIAIEILLSLSACTKPAIDKQPILSSAYYQRELSTITLNAENPNNPYDSIGRLHNKILAEIQPCVEVYNPLTDGYIQGCILKIDTSDNNTTAAPPFSLARTVVNDRPNNFINVIANAAYSATAKQLMDSLVSIVYNAAVHSNGNYVSIKSAIETFEASLTGNLSVAANERKTLLEMTSVARFSICYWLNQSQRPGLSLKKFVTIVATAMTDAVSLAVARNVDFAADSSEEAWFDMTYYIPG